MNDLILNVVARNLIPFIIVYGAYVTTNGHLSPGGGFAGGTIIAAALILAVLTWGLENTGLCDREEMLCGAEAASLLGYAGVGAVALFVGRPYLSNLSAGVPGGTPGALLSAGLIWVLGGIIGIKVAATLTGVYNRLSEAEDESPDPHAQGHGGGRNHGDGHGDSLDG